MDDFPILIARCRRCIQLIWDDHLRYINSTRDAIERGENINEKGETGNTAVHIACFDVFDPAFLQNLLRYRPNLNIQNELLQTPLHVYMKSLFFRSSVLESLLQKGADPNLLDVEGNTPLHYLMDYPLTVEDDSEILTRTFLMYNAEVNIQNMNGDTPLHLAVNRRNVRCIATFLYTDASVLIKNNENFTALDLAYKYMNDEPEVFVEMAKFAVVLNHCRIPVHPSVLDEIHSNESLRIFNEQCEEEISILSNIKVRDTNVTLDVILKSSTYAIAKYLRNDLILKSLQNLEPVQYKIFGNRLKQHFKDGLARNEAEDLGYIFLRKLCPNLPELCVYEVIFYIKNEDLNQLKKVYNTYK